MLAADHCCASTPLIVAIAVPSKSVADLIWTIQCHSKSFLFSARAARCDHFPRTAHRLEASCAIQFQYSAARHNAIQCESTASPHPALPWRRFSPLFTAIAIPYSATAAPRVSIQSNSRAYLSISVASPLRPMQFPIKSFLCASGARLVKAIPRHFRAIPSLSGTMQFPGSAYLLAANANQFDSNPLQGLRFFAKAHQCFSNPSRVVSFLGFAYAPQGYV